MSPSLVSARALKKAGRSPLWSVCRCVNNTVSTLSKPSSNSPIRKNAPGPASTKIRGTPPTSTMKLDPALPNARGPPEPSTTTSNAGFAAAAHRQAGNKTKNATPSVINFFITDSQFIDLLGHVMSFVPLANRQIPQDEDCPPDSNQYEESIENLS